LDLPPALSVRAGKKMKKPIIVDDSIRIPSSQEYLIDVDSFLEGILRGYGIDESIIADIAISVTEMVNNGIIHGNRSDPDKEIEISIYRKNSDVEIAIRDQGEGFNPDAVSSPIDDANLMREVGRGIFIARSLMDTVRFQFSPGHGTEVTLVKKIN
jgi:serine/threonine-protein kinase RsbW